MNTMTDDHDDGERAMSLFAHDEPQIDHNEPGKPWTAHERYVIPGEDGCSGTRRLAYGATKLAALSLAQHNRRKYPPGTDVPLEATLGWPGIETLSDGRTPR